MPSLLRQLQADTPPQENNTGDGNSEEWGVVALLIAMSLLGAVLLIGRTLVHRKVTWIGEAGAALLLGLLVGLIMRVGGAGPHLKSEISFNSFIFLNVMLPAIMFDAGYTLDPRLFIRNMGSVCMFAFVGTTISTFVIGLILWGVGQAGWATDLPLIYNLLFGSIISATDPVTVLAVFSRLGANEDLYVNVFGESVLNDAVALVLYNTLRTYVGATVTAAGVVKGIGLFVGIFVGSVAMGMVAGFVAAALFRTGWIQDPHHPVTETGVVMVVGFISYLAAQAAHLSGICSVLFCGMVLRSYVKPNLTHDSVERVEAVLKTVAELFELFLFVYIGLTLFLVDEEFHIWAYTGFCLLALAVARAANIVPCASLINWLRLPHRRMPAKQQFMMWWSGLRGAMAFALAIDAADSFGQPGAIMKTCTFYVVFVTVLVNGGACTYLLEKLDLKQAPSQAALLGPELQPDAEAADGYVGAGPATFDDGGSLDGVGRGNHAHGRLMALSAPAAPAKGPLAGTITNGLKSHSLGARTSLHPIGDADGPGSTGEEDAADGSAFNAAAASSPAETSGFVCQVVNGVGTEPSAPEGMEKGGGSILLLRDAAAMNAALGDSRGHTATEDAAGGPSSESGLLPSTQGNAPDELELQVPSTSERPRSGSALRRLREFNSVHMEAHLSRLSAAIKRRLTTTSAAVASSSNSQQQLTGEGAATGQPGEVQPRRARQGVGAVSMPPGRGAGGGAQGRSRRVEMGPLTSQSAAVGSRQREGPLPF